MTAAKKPKKQKLRNAEYYNLQETFDKLYLDSKNGTYASDTVGAEYPSCIPESEKEQREQDGGNR